ncbi:PAS domain S-box protein [Anaerobacillus alkaliphilus]|uniref:PAS domain S-box protein n=1 Tax=Anaerobacillus alkaliphilus TaxID=1548597 RepID=A0A4Q0VTU6_9BACI|nr:PAS domain S-box protein [Anaerobacillus alkaliphilus]RXJ02060.1 PAS domain S-box protein [Anaerobacillus alkaliphilus]
MSIHTGDLEKNRLEELYSLNILDTEKEIAFDRITKIVSKAFNVPICLISLVEKDRQWFKACVGLEDITETSREVAFCHYVVVEEKPLVVEDATLDHRFAQNPLVTGALHLRFYAGAPLRTKQGNILGTLCLIDTKPRKFSYEQMSLLKEYASLVMSEIELRSMLRNNLILSTAINKTATGVTITDPTLPNNPLIFVNEAFTNITGYSEEDVLGKNCKFLQGSSTDIKTLKEISEAIRNRNSLHVELLNYRKDGSEFWNELKIDPIYDENAKLTHFVGFQTDITSKKNAELEISLRKQRYQALFHSNNDAVYMIDTFGYFIEVNEGCEKLTGYTASEFEKLHFIDLIVDKHKTKTMEQFNRIIHQFDHVQFETQLNHKDGTAKYINIQASPITIEGRVVGLYGISKDVTLIKESEKQLKITAKLFESMKEAILILDEEFNIISTNNSFQALIGITKEKLINQNLFSLLDDQIISPTIKKDILSNIKHGNIPWEGQITVKLHRNELKTLWLSVDTILNNDDGTPSNVVCMLRDISEKEQIQNDVKLAGLMQKNFLPQDLNNEFLSVTSLFKPNQYVSGDFFEYNWIETDNRLVGILYDAMGHGVTTALQTTGLRVLFQDISKRNLPLPEKVKCLNTEILNYLSEETFVAALYFEFNLDNQTLYYVPCGINEFFLERKGEISKYTTPAFVIGMFEDAEFELFSLKLEEEDSLHFITDGIMDVLPRNFSNKDLASKDFFYYIEEVCRSRMLDDDATAIKITVKPQNKRLFNDTVASVNTKDIDQMKQKIAVILQEKYLTEHLFVELAFNEALNNAIRASTSIEVTLFLKSGYLGITITDDGPGFDVRSKLCELMAKKDSMMDELIWSESGRGIYLMHKFMDKIEYNLVGNQVTLLKKFGGTNSEN